MGLGEGSGSYNFIMGNKTIKELKIEMRPAPVYKNPVVLLTDNENLRNGACLALLIILILVLLYLWRRRPAKEVSKRADS